MINWLKKHCKIIAYSLIIVCVFIVLIIVMLLLLNWAFKQKAYIPLLEAEWSADAAISFLGTIIASCMAVCGVMLTIWYSREEYKKDERNRILPYMSLSTKDLRRDRVMPSILKDSSCTSDTSSECNNLNTTYISSLYFVISDGIEMKKNLTSDQRELLYHGGLSTEHEGKKHSLKNSHIISQQFEITNVGNGTAAFFQIGLKKVDTPESMMYFSLCSPFRKNQVFHFTIFSEAEICKIKGEYVLELYYEDITQNTYSQKYSIEIKPNNENERSSIIYIELVGRQKLEKIREKKENKRNG